MVGSNLIDAPPGLCQWTYAISIIVRGMNRFYFGRGRGRACRVIDRRVTFTSHPGQYGRSLPFDVALRATKSSLRMKLSMLMSRGEEGHLENRWLTAVVSSSAFFIR